MKQSGLSPNCDVRLSIFAICLFPARLYRTHPVWVQQLRKNIIALSRALSPALKRLFSSKHLLLRAQAPISRDTMSAVPLLLSCLVVLAITRLCNGACTYNVTIETGSRPGASAKAGVMMKLREGKRSTPWILIQNKSGTNFLSNSKFKVSFDGVCMTQPCVTLRMMTRKDRWFAKSLKIEVPDEHSEVVINNLQFDISHWVTTRGYTTCAVDKTAYVAFGRPV